MIEGRETRRRMAAGIREIREKEVTSVNIYRQVV